METPKDTAELVAKSWIIQRTLAPLLSTIPEKLLLASEALSREYMNPDLSINDIAENIGLPVPTLSRQFKKWYGLSPVQYLQNTQIAAAKQFLDDGHYSIAKIAKILVTTAPLPLSIPSKKSLE